MNKMLINRKRPSPRIEGMFHHVSKDGTIWAFESKDQMRKFVRQHRENGKTKHFLSPREICNFLYGDRTLTTGL